MNKKLLAFIHINKAAGTTLTHILRQNFFLRHFDLQFPSNSSYRIFQSNDLKKIFRINPFIESIAGHNIRVFSDLSDNFPDVRYITLLRDPIKRTISHFYYNRRKHGSGLSFYEYLNQDASFNRQTRIIAGANDLNLAKNYVANKFFLVGIVEEFDEFLILLKRKLNRRNFLLKYKLQNVGKNYSAIQESIENKMSEYQKYLVSKNLSDIQLYKYVKEEILPKQKKEYGKYFEIDLKNLKDKKKAKIISPRLYIDYVFRKIYYRPVIKYLESIK